MAKSCKEVAQSLIDCAENGVYEKGGDLRTCMKAHEVRNADGSADVTEASSRAQDSLFQLQARFSRHAIEDPWTESLLSCACMI